jgi:hypothetical protein
LGSFNMMQRWLHAALAILLLSAAACLLQSLPGSADELLCYVGLGLTTAAAGVHDEWRALVSGSGTSPPDTVMKGVLVH